MENFLCQVERDDGTFFDARFKERKGRFVTVSTGPKLLVVPWTKVFVMHRGYPRPLSQHPSEKKYNKRKQVENDTIIHVYLTHVGGSLTDVCILALDDFEKGGRRGSIPNTMRTWLRHLGRAENFYCPNPDIDVVKAVETQGGHAAAMSMFDYISKNWQQLPRFGMVYADYCGLWSTHARDFELLLRYHTALLADTVVVITTTSRREHGGIPTTFDDMKTFCVESGYGTATLIEISTTSTMYKHAFLLRRFDRHRRRRN